jgi:Zn-dependent M28 family amino/carboxypeptidase
VVFVAFADEEHGFLGSVDYCRRHEATLDQTVGMVCLDALAWAFPGGQSLHADPSMGDYAAARAREVGWDPAIVDASLLLGSDHNSFIDAGVPACWFWRYPPQHPGYHSTGDRLDIIDFDLVAETARVAAHTAFSLADEAGAAPLGRSRPTRRWLDLRPNGGVKGDRQNDVQPCLDTGPGDARTATVAVRDPGIQ